MEEKKAKFSSYEFFSIRKNRLLILVVLLYAAFGSLMAKVADYIIFNYYPDRPAPPDLIHDLTPYIQPLEYISDITLFIMVIIFIYYILKYREREGAFHMYNISTIYLIRSFLNTVTPLGKPLGNNTSHGILKDYVIQYGMFPSGHVALTFYLFLAIDKKYKNIKITMLILFVIELVTMLLSQGHFSIDVFGAMILSYAVYKFFLDYKERFLFELPE